MESKAPFARGAAYKALRSNGTAAARSHSAPDSASLFLDSPGKKYPRLCLLFIGLVLFFLISWLPHLTEKPRGPLAFVWPSNQSRNARHLVRPDEVTTTLSPPDLCNSSLTPAPYLLVVVCSAVDNFEAREAIRGSWGQDQVQLSQVRVVFLVGHLVNQTRQERLVEEAHTHGDLVQEGFLDSYANLTVKSVMLLKWFTQVCDKTENGAPSPSSSSIPRYVLKTDDDMYINLVRLFEMVQANKKPKLLMGSLICNAVPIKDPYNKWYVPAYMFSERRYPNYLSGTAYLMGRATVSALYQAALATDLFHLEDIYITGILARKANIKPTDNIGFSYTRRKLNSCLFRQTVSTHHVKHSEMRAIYSKLSQTPPTSCAPIRAKLLREYGPGKCRWPRQNG